MDTGERGDEAQVPHWVGAQSVAFQVQFLQGDEGGKRGLVNEHEQVLLQKKIPQRSEILKLVAFKTADQVVLEMQHLKLCQAIEGLVVDGLNLAVVQEEFTHSLPPNEGLTLQLASQVVPVHVDDGGVHGNEWRDD